MKLLILLAALFAAPTAALADGAFPTKVKVEGGVLRGAAADGVVSFKGVPFAAPPVGARRWRPPQPVRPWQGVRNAAAYGHDCMQEPFPSDAAPLGTKPTPASWYRNEVSAFK